MNWISAEQTQSRLEAEQTQNLVAILPKVCKVISFMTGKIKPHHSRKKVGKSGLSENCTLVLLIPTSGFDEQSTLFTALRHFELSLKISRGSPCKLVATASHSNYSETPRLERGSVWGCISLERLASFFCLSHAGFGNWSKALSFFGRSV